MSVSKMRVRRQPAHAGRQAMEKDATWFGWLTRNDPRNYVPVYAGMSPRGVRGSGELTMATNVAAGLRDAGLNAVLYDPTPAQFKRAYAILRRQGVPPEEAMMQATQRYFSDPAEAAREASLYRLGRRSYTMSPIEALKGKPVEELMAASRSGEFVQVLKMLNGTSPRETRRNFVKFKRLLDRGAFDGITPGGLRDHLFRGRDAILNGKVVLGDPRQLWSRANAGKGSTYFNGADGMWYSDMPQGKEPVVGGGNSLGRMVGFNANYNPGDPRPLSHSVIPFTDVGKTWADRVPGLAGLRQMMARRALARYMSGQLGVPASSIRGKKLVMLSAGGGGVNIPLKMQQVHDAVSGRGDVVFLVNAGSNKDTFARASELARRFNQAEGGPRYIVNQGFAPAVSRRFTGAADVNLTYGGSSTLSEALANRNPSLFMRDTPLNESNIGWAKERFPKIPTFDSAGVAARDYANALKARGVFSGAPGVLNSAENFWRHGVGSWEQRGPYAVDHVPGLTHWPHFVNYTGRNVLIDPNLERAEFARRLNDILDNPRGYRDYARGVSSQFMGALDAANQRVVNTAVGANGGLYAGRFRLPNWMLRTGGIQPVPMTRAMTVYRPPAMRRFMGLFPRLFRGIRR